MIFKRITLLLLLLHSLLIIRINNNFIYTVIKSHAEFLSNELEPDVCRVPCHTIEYIYCYYKFIKRDTNRPLKRLFVQIRKSRFSLKWLIQSDIRFPSLPRLPPPPPPPPSSKWKTPSLNNLTRVLIRLMRSSFFVPPYPLLFVKIRSLKGNCSRDSIEAYQIARRVKAFSHSRPHARYLTSWTRSKFTPRRLPSTNKGGEAVRDQSSRANSCDEFFSNNSVLCWEGGGGGESWRRKGKKAARENEFIVSAD